MSRLMILSKGTTMTKWLFPLIFSFIVVIGSGVVNGQGGTGGGGGGTGGGGGGTGGGGGGNGGTGTGGIEIDAAGVLRSAITLDPTGKIDRERARSAKASLNQDLQRPSKMRMVSLNRLEAAVQESLSSGKPLSDELRFVAGLTRVTHVFYFPDSKDIVIAGPAEGFFVNSRNRVVGTETGASILQLEDLVVALRAFGPDGETTKVISVSIDPTREGQIAYLAAFQNWGPLVVQGKANEQLVRQELVKAMGLQNVTIKGVSPKTRFAQVLTEADYRMKLIGLGLEQPAVKINSYYDHMPMISGNGNSIRWFFEPNYECVMVSQDESSMSIVGSGVKLVPDEDRIDSLGNRVSTGKANKASRTFCGSFTKEYDKLAAKETLYGELRSLVDLSVVGAFIQKMDLYEKSGWKMPFFNNESKFVTERFNAPQHVEPVINFAFRDGAFSAPIGGGVNIQPRIALTEGKAKTDDTGKIDEVKNQVKLDNLNKGQWWWDQEVSSPKGK